MFTEENNIFIKAQYAAEQYKEGEVREKAQMLLFEYTAEKVETGKTLPKFLEEKGISFEEETTVILMEIDEYIVTVDKKTYEIISVEKATNQVKITLSKNVVDVGEELKATIVLSKNINKSTCKYAFEKQDVNVAEGDITTSVPDGLEITLPTSTKGNYYFYLLYNNGKENKIKKVPVTVGIAVEEIVLNKTSITLDKGDTETLSITEIKPSNATDKTTEWTSLDTTVATVDASGVVTAVKGGTAKIRATAKDGSGVYGECTVTVNPKLVESVAFEKETENINLGGEKILAVTVLPANADNTELEWTSTNSKIKVDSTGKVTLDGAAAGDTATITAKSKDGTNKTATCTITVKEQTAEVGASSHTAKPLTYSWEEINELAKKISLNYETEEGTARITKDTEEVKMGDYTIGVGDTIAVGSYTARVLGFNQDLLAASVTDPYGDGEDKPHTRAGISFEFVSFLMNAPLHSNSGGVTWAACTLRSTLNNTTINNLANKNYIKLVTKKYIPDGDVASTATCEDKLWLLACSEIWYNGQDGGSYGHAITSESEGRYKFYAKSNPSCSVQASCLNKPVRGKYLRLVLEASLEFHQLEILHCQPG